MRNKKKLLLLLMCTALLLPVSGCSKSGAQTKLVLTTGFKRDEIFRIETMSCTLPEVLVYLTNTQDQYESVYGKEIWKNFAFYCSNRYCRCRCLLLYAEKGFCG